ncbi:MAG: DMT family transporter [Spirochaetia bacterium]|nr:DMT family transporter [Spirochaetia bacterium]
MKSITADLSLLITGVIWGSGFIATHSAIEAGFSTSLILLFRFSLAAFALLLIAYKKVSRISKSEAIIGLIAGLFLFLAFFFQTLGLKYTSPSNNAFLTGVNVVFVPFVAWAVFKKKPKKKFFFIPFITLIGIGFLSYNTTHGFSFSIGDIFTLLCALVFAFHIAYLEVASKKVEAVKLTFIQMSVATIASIFFFLIFDKGSIGEADLVKGFFPLIYIGLVSTLIGFFIQTYAQQFTTASKTAIFLSSESLFGAFFSVMLHLEPLTVNMVIGGAIIFASILVSELKFKKKVLLPIKQ